MIRTFKNILLYLLIGLLLVNTSSSLIYFKLKECFIEASAKNAIKEHRFNSDKVCRWDAAKVAIEWEGSDEIIVDGQYYDVLYTEASHYGDIIYCIADDDETSLYNWYANFIEEDSGEDDNAENFILAVKWYNLQTNTIAYTEKFIRLISTLYTVPKLMSYYQVAYPPPEFTPVV